MKAHGEGIFYFGEHTWYEEGNAEAEQKAKEYLQLLSLDFQFPI